MKRALSAATPTQDSLDQLDLSTTVEKTGGSGYEMNQDFAVVGGLLVATIIGIFACKRRACRKGTAKEHADVTTNEGGVDPTDFGVFGEDSV